MWHLRHLLQFWQLKTWIHDNLFCLAIKSDTGQHSQFLFRDNTAYFLPFIFNNCLNHRKNTHKYHILKQICPFIINFMIYAFFLWQSNIPINTQHATITTSTHPMTPKRRTLSWPLSAFRKELFCLVQFGLFIINVCTILFSSFQDKINTHTSLSAFSSS